VSYSRSNTPELILHLMSGFWCNATVNSSRFSKKDRQRMSVTRLLCQTKRFWTALEIASSRSPKAPTTFAGLFQLHQMTLMSAKFMEGSSSCKRLRALSGSSDEWPRMREIALLILISWPNGFATRVDRLPWSVESSWAAYIDPYVDWS